MSSLTLKNVSVSFPIYEASRSLRRALLRSSVTDGRQSISDRGPVEVNALRNINLDIQAGDRLALIGPNGAGKSTLLRVLAGIYSPSAGDIECRGRVMPLFDIHMGFDEDATGYENITLRGLLLGQTRAQIAARLPEIEAFSGLGSFLNLPVRTYSSGMTFRLLFAIATSIESDILLMDEWIATGDQSFTAKADARLRDLIGRTQVLVLASHHPQLLQNLCNRAIVIDGGQIVFCGSVDDAVAFYSASQAA